VRRLGRVGGAQGDRWEVRGREVSHGGPLQAREVAHDLSEYCTQSSERYSRFARREVFQFMFDGKHMGKIVLSHPKGHNGGQGLAVLTGAFGGIGELYAHELPSKARLLMGCCGATAQHAQVLAALPSTTMVGLCDVSSVADVGCVMSLTSSATGRRPLLVLHLAGVLKDLLLRDMSGSDLKLVLQPKVLGLRSMHQSSCGGARTVLFFSVSNVGQANYGAANGFLAPAVALA
jgi:hypothetical protein